MSQETPSQEELDKMHEEALTEDTDREEMKKNAQDIINTNFDKLTNLDTLVYDESMTSFNVTEIRTPFDISKVDKEQLLGDIVKITNGKLDTKEGYVVSLSKNGKDLYVICCYEENLPNHHVFLKIIRRPYDGNYNDPDGVTRSLKQKNTESITNNATEEESHRGLELISGQLKDLDSLFESADAEIPDHEMMRLIVPSLDVDTNKLPENVATLTNGKISSDGAKVFSLSKKEGYYFTLTIHGDEIQIAKESFVGLEENVKVGKYSEEDRATIESLKNI